MSVASDVKNLSIVDGDLLDAKEQYLVHQCNCVTIRGAHLSANVFNRFPHANIYFERLKSSKKDQPGKIIVRGSPDDNKAGRAIINMLAQYYPGKSRFANDTGTWRRQWFQSCLDQIAALPNLESLAFPYNIGCGAAGGSWQLYYDMIIKFAQVLPKVKITLYRLAAPADTSKTITDSKRTHSPHSCIEIACKDDLIR